MNDRPGYPWSEGDALFASELNAAIANSGGGTSSANVLQYGAKGDGVTDDTASIQTALNVNAGKAVVFIPDTGQPYMVRTLRPPSNTSLIIAGTLMQQPNMVSESPLTTGIIAIEHVNNITIGGIGKLDGNWLNQTFNGLAGISAFQCTNVRITGLTITHTYTWSANIVTCNHVIVSECTFKDCRAEAEFASGCNDCWLLNCVQDGVTADGGFSFYGGTTNSGIVGCVLKNSFGDGMSIVADPAQAGSCKGIVIANNVIHDNKDTGIYITSSGVNAIHEDITITGNILYNNNTANGASGNSFPASDIWVSSCRGIVVSGNKCGPSGAGTFNTYGISIGGWGGYQASWGVSVTGNDIRNMGQGSTTGVGIFLAPVQGNDIMISGNHIYDENQTTPTMLHGIAGSCGLRTAIVGNHLGSFGGSAISVTPQTDTVIANASPGFYTLAPGTTLATTSPQEIANSTGVPRWYIGSDGTAESGGNAGANYTIKAVNDANSAITTALTINRATSLLTITGGATFQTAANDWVDLTNALTLAPGYGINEFGTYINLIAPTGGNFAFQIGGNLAVSVRATGLTSTSLLQVGGVTGPTWTTGSAVPSSTQPVGSLYSRVSTWAAGATLYVSKGAGAWTPVAGV